MDSFFWDTPAPPKHPEKARVDHWPSIRCPSLFIEGTRDSLCDLDLLRSSLPSLGGPSTLMPLEGGDHSFKVPKAMNPDPDAIHGEVIQRITRWMESLPGE